MFGLQINETFNSFDLIPPGISKSFDGFGDYLKMILSFSVIEMNKTTLIPYRKYDIKINLEIKS